MSSRGQTLSRFLSPPVPEPFDASGVFETCRVRDGKILHLKEHLTRLKASLKTLEISCEESPIRRALEEAAAGLREGTVRIAVRRRGRPRFILHRRSGLPYSAAVIQRGIAVRTVPTRWPLNAGGTAQVKGSERVNGVLSRLEGGDSAEVLRMGSHGYLTEGTISNLFLVREGALMTPPAWLGVLEGVTRAQVIRAARRLKIPVKEIPLTRHELFNAQEAFLTNVLMGILPIRQADGRRIGARFPGPITRRLMEILRRRRVEGQR